MIIHTVLKNNYELIDHCTSCDIQDTVYRFYFDLFNMCTLLVISVYL